MFGTYVDSSYPGELAGGHGEAEGDGGEGNPAGLGVEAYHGYFPIACVADQDQGRDAQDVQHPDAGECAGNEQQRLGKAALLAEIPEPDDGEGQHKAEAFKTRAGLGDDDGEARRADGEGGCIDINAGQKKPEDDLYGVKGGDLQRASRRGTGCIPKGLEREAEAPSQCPVRVE